MVRLGKGLFADVPFMALFLRHFWLLPESGFCVPVKLTKFQFNFFYDVWKKHTAQCSVFVVIP